MFQDHKLCTPVQYYGSVIITARSTHHTEHGECSRTARYSRWRHEISRVYRSRDASRSCHSRGLSSRLRSNTPTARKSCPQPEKKDPLKSNKYRYSNDVYYDKMYIITLTRSILDVNSDHSLNLIRMPVKQFKISSILNKHRLRTEIHSILVIYFFLVFFSDSQRPMDRARTLENSRESEIPCSLAIGVPVQI